MPMALANSDRIAIPAPNPATAPNAPKSKKLTDCGDWLIKSENSDTNDRAAITPNIIVGSIKIKRTASSGRNFLPAALKPALTLSGCCSSMALSMQYNPARAYVEITNNTIATTAPMAINELKSIALNTCRSTSRPPSGRLASCVLFLKPKLILEVLPPKAANNPKTHSVLFRQKIDQDRLNSDH